MDKVQFFNALEAAFWLLLALSTAATGHRTTGFTPRRQLALTMFLAGFGISDIWEIYSGAWWHPMSLLLLKAICLTGLVVTAGLIYVTRWSRRLLELDRCQEGSSSGL
jgi:hypothetical protein